MTNPEAALAQVAHGPSLAGIFMNVMLYGVMMSQSFFYFSTYKSDPVWLKVYVSLLLLADTLNSIFNMWWIYNVLVNNFGNVTALENADWLFESEEALAGIIAMAVQLLYAWRILRLTGNYFTVAVIVAASLVGGLSGIGTAIAVAMRPAFTDFQHLKVIVILWLMGAAVCDVLITVALTWHLRQRRTGFGQTDTIISRIIQLTVSNGLLTAGFALADVIAFLSTPRGIHIAFNYTLVKLYGNSMMASLNSRSVLQSRDKTFSGKDLSMHVGRNTDISGIVSSSNRISCRPAQVVVNVETHELVNVTGSNDKTDPEWLGANLRDSDVKEAIAT